MCERGLVEPVLEALGAIRASSRDEGAVVEFGAEVADASIRRPLRASPLALAANGKWYVASS
jgi:hypothetical protein